MRLFIDESLSPRLAIWLNDTGRHDAVHPLHVGRRGEPDHRVLERCIAEDRVLVVQNARDFRALVGAADIHPGLIILPALNRDTTWSLLRQAIAYLEVAGDPMDVMVNSMLEIGADGAIRLVPMPA